MGRPTTDSVAVESEGKMIEIEDLAGLKLVHADNIALIGMKKQELEIAFQKGSQGWGVKREQSVLLRMAQELTAALALAKTADESHRMLKGCQLKLGRVEAALARLEGSDGKVAT